MRDLAYLIPPPMPGDDQVKTAAEKLADLSECDQLHGWWATFRRDDLSFTGTWPEDWDYGDFYQVDVRVTHWSPDHADFDGSTARQQARCELEIRHAIERGDLELKLMRHALEERDERLAEEGAR